MPPRYPSEGLRAACQFDRVPPFATADMNRKEWTVDSPLVKALRQYAADHRRLSSHAMGAAIRRREINSIVAKRAAAQTNSATKAMPTIDNHSKVNPLSGLDRSTSTMMLDLPKL